MKTIIRSQHFALVVLTILCSATLHAGDALAGDVLETDQWFVGDLNGQPAMTMHAVVTRHADGSRSDAMDAKVVIARSLGGTAIRFEVDDTQRFEEDASGRITAFVLDHVENDQPASAAGHVAGDQVVATIHHLDRADEQKLAIPAGVKLLGQQASQDLLAKRAWKAGDQETFATVALVSNQVQIVQATATFKQASAEGNLTFEVIMDVVPIPTTMTITPKGDLVAMAMNMGFITMAFRPSKGPVPLEGAELAATGLVTAKGPAPSAGPRNRYRFPPGASAAADEFQSVAMEAPGGASADGKPLPATAMVTVTSEAKPSPLADPKPFLRAEPQLELDDPALRAWVEGVADKHRGDQAELAEHLRLAVRAYIVHKDLSMGDASALEAFRTRRGDCTEHANLLCAALRIAGIPARVECGMVYADSFGGWVGHAWNSAYVDGRWIHLDSAYPGVERSCYLKLGSPSGGEWKATGAAMIANLAKVMGKEVETLAEERK